MKLLPNPHQRMSENRLLASLPEGLKTRWQPHLELVELPLGQVLYEASRLMADVFFPITAIVSLLYGKPSGKHVMAVEVQRT